MFRNKRHNRDFKLRHREEEPEPSPEGEEKEKKHVRIESPNRSNYPRILDLWPIFLIMSLLLIFVLVAIRTFI